MTPKNYAFYERERERESNSLGIISLRFAKICIVFFCASFLSFILTPGYAHADIVVTTASSSPVSLTSETLNGSIINDTGIGVTQSGFEYSTMNDGFFPGNLSSQFDVTVTTLGPQTGNTSFSQTLTGLTPNTTYYFMAYAVDSTGAEFDGPVLSFNIYSPYFEEVQDAPVLVKGGTYNGWEADSFAAPAVTYDGTRYVMTVSMFSTAEDKWASGFFTSPNMKTWTYVNNSLFSPSVSDDLLGNAGLAWFQGKYWFAFDYGQTALAVANSSDLLSWSTKATPASYGADASLDINPVSGKLEVWYMTDSRNVHMQDSYNGTVWKDEGDYLSEASVDPGSDFGEPSVFYLGNTRYMVFDGGYSSGNRNIFLLHSVNQDTNWDYVPAVVALSNNPNNEWESQQVFDGSVLVANLGDGRGLVPRLVYAGSDNHSSTDATNSSIGLAYPVTLPFVTTSAPSSVKSSILTMNGLISNVGQNGISQSGFIYGTDPALSSSTTTTTLGSHSGVFSQIITGLTSNTAYYYRAYAANLAGTSMGAILSTTTLAAVVPDAPTIGTATASDAQATVVFTAPDNNGGSPILYYIASSIPGNFIATSTGSPILVTGLTNGTPHTFQVYAVNAVGTSTPSLASNSVTPAVVILPTYAIGGIISGLTGMLVLQNNSGDDLTLTSNGPFTFNTSIANGNPYGVSVLTQPSGQTCSVSNGSGNVSGNVTSISVTCTANPVTTTPTVNPTASYSSSSGSSGGGSTIQQLAKIFAPSASTTEYLNSLTVPGCPTGLVCTPNLASTPIVLNLPSVNLTLGSQGNDVTALQNFLIMHSYLDAFYNTGYFGPLTQTALAKYQKDHGIFPASGYYGSITRAAVNTTPNAAVTTSTTASTTTFNRVLTIGSIGSDVQALQQFLNAHGFTLVESGAGSSGNETTYFGSATEAALAKFQQANGITPAVGYFGPITMKAVNTLFKSQ